MRITGNREKKICESCINLVMSCKGGLARTDYMRYYFGITIINNSSSSSSSKLNIESGRYRNIERSERICTLCNANVIEDEYHFIIECPQYKDLRCKYIKLYYYKHPSVYRFIQLLTTSNNKELKNLGKYLVQANTIRDRLM